MGSRLVQNRRRILVSENKGEPSRKPTLSLPPLDGLTFIVTGSTSGIGLETARQIAPAGGHVVMAVRKIKLAQELIRKWQEEKGGMGVPLNVKVMELDLLSLDSVMKFAEAWNA